MYKNTASQKLAVYAYDAVDGDPVTGDAANITAQIAKDGAACAATDDTNPTELDATDAPGVYLFDLTQAETNANLIVVAAVSSTSDVRIDPAIVYTQPTLGSDGKPLISTDAQDLSASLDVNAKTLGDDCITSAKYDESSAFPVASADSGSTQIARVGADADTLETLSDQLDTVTSEVQSDYYDVKVQVGIDDNATTATDIWLVLIYKNGALLTAGVTSPTITVYHDDDGDWSTLINAQTLTPQAAGSGWLRYAATGAERITRGEPLKAKIVATIDGGSRTMYAPLSRDEP